MAKLDAGSRPGQFGGVPGVYGNVDMGDPLPPHLEAQAAREADEADSGALPSHGTNGERVV